MPKKVRFLLGISLVSAHILALELILTRFFSISQGYHYAFLVVSMAFLGFGAGSIMLFSRRLRKYQELDFFLPGLALLMGLTVILSFYLANQLTFNPIELLWNENKLWLMPANFLILSLPFFLGGLTISLALTRFSTIVHQVYFADLTGAGLGIILSALGFRLAGDLGAVRILILLALGASWLFFSWKKATRTSKAVQTATSLLALAIAFFAGESLSFKVSDFKPLSFYLKQKDSAIRKTLWDETLRLDLFDSPAIRYAPGLSLKFDGQLPEQTGLSLDAEKITALMKQPIDPSKLSFLDYLPLSFAFKQVSGRKVLLLQPESDLAFFLGLKAEAEQIVSFEENSLLQKVHQAKLSKLPEWRKIDDQVKLITIEARAGLEQEKKKNKVYDLIVFPLPDLPGSFSSGFYGPEEDYLLTKEAAGITFDLLDSEGLVAAVFYFLPPPRQELRFLALWIEVLEERGLKPERHILILRTVETISFFIKKEPFSIQEIQSWETFSEERFYDLAIPWMPPEPSSTVFIQSDLSTWEELVGNLFIPEKRQNLYRNYLFEVRPPVDDRPFFWDFFKWSRLTDILKLFDQKTYPLFLGKYLLAFLLAQALIIGLLVIILPLTRSARHQLNQVRQKSLIFCYFAGLGFGYMLVEITLFHKFILLLGHPTYSLSAVLFFLLSASGAGSLSLLGLEKRLGQPRLIFWPLLCLLVIILEILILNIAGPIFLQASLPLRFILSFFLIFPLGFFLGIPFPAGLKFFQQESLLTTPFAFATNSFFSLLASVWGLVQAQLWGYSSVFCLAAVCYFLSFFFFYFAYHRNKSNVK